MADAETSVAEYERQAFRTLNAFVEPLIRAGLGGPLLMPFGAIVLETTGRTSGIARRTPLLGAVVGRSVVVSTYRGDRSQWIKNLQANSRASWWVNGVRATGAALVFTQGAWPKADKIPNELRSCAEIAWRPTIQSGWAVAVLEPDHSVD